MDTAADAESRRTLLVRQVMARRGQDDELVVHALDQRGSGAAGRPGDRSEPAAARTLRYADRVLELRLAAGERDRLDALLDEYPVFKIKQPETRKAETATYVSAVADPKHLADFIEDCCRRVYGLSEAYRLRVA